MFLPSQMPSDLLDLVIQVAQDGFRRGGKGFVYAEDTPTGTIDVSYVPQSALDENNPLYTDDIRRMLADYDPAVQFVFMCIHPDRPRSQEGEVEVFTGRYGFVGRVVVLVDQQPPVA